MNDIEVFQIQIALGVLLAVVIVVYLLLVRWRHKREQAQREADAQAAAWRRVDITLKDRRILHVKFQDASIQVKGATIDPDKLSSMNAVGNDALNLSLGTDEVMFPLNEVSGHIRVAAEGVSDALTVNVKDIKSLYRGHAG